MTVTSRRALLSAFAALPAITLPASSTAGPHPDAELLELGRQHAEAAALYDRLGDSAIEAEERAEADAPPRPTMLREDWYTSSLDAGKPYTPLEIARWREGLARDDIGLSVASMARFKARGAEVMAAWDAHIQGLADAKARHGCARAEALADAAGTDHYALEERIFATPAATPEGLKVKARIAANVLGAEPDGTYEDQLIRSILADLLALA